MQNLLTFQYSRESFSQEGFFFFTCVFFFKLKDCVAAYCNYIFLSPLSISAPSNSLTEGKGIMEIMLSGDSRDCLSFFQRLKEHSFVRTHSSWKIMAVTLLGDGSSSVGKLDSDCRNHKYKGKSLLSSGAF